MFIMRSAVHLACTRGGCGCLVETAGAAALCLEGGSCGCLPLTPAAAAAGVLEPEILPPTIAKIVNDPPFALRGGGSFWGCELCVLAWKGAVAAGKV